MVPAPHMHFGCSHIADTADTYKKRTGKSPPPTPAIPDVPAADAVETSGEAETPAASAADYGDVIFPFAAYGTSQSPAAEDVLIRGATVWTMEEEGVLEDADVLIRDGRIAAVGTDLNAGSARVIEAEGLHVTPGIIDEHSHIALSAVNDVAMNSAMLSSRCVASSFTAAMLVLASAVSPAQRLRSMVMTSR